MFFIFSSVLLCRGAATGEEPVPVGKWQRQVIVLSNPTYSGNPFELEVSASFKHQETGTVITLPGYYAGRDTWKIAFMPTRTGKWTFRTSSADPDLKGVTGSILCLPSGHPGPLTADPLNPKKWKYSDGGYAVPIALRIEFFSEPASESAFIAAADFIKNHRMQMMETRLTEEIGQFENGRHDFIFKGSWKDHRFDLSVWDRMERRMEILTERGLGAQIMFYSDDAGTPGWPAQSPTEELVIRYTIARLAAFPTVWFNTGIDIDEYRDQAWVNWFGRRIRSLDPYGHPVSSRYGGGSGNLIMAGQTFESRGDKPAKVQDMQQHFLNASIPVSMDDCWSENWPEQRERNFSPGDIRRAFWKCLISGGLGGQIRGSKGYFYLHNLASDLESEQWLKWIHLFLDRELGAVFGRMAPDPSLASNGYALADPEKSRLVFLLIGKNDRWDPGSGGPVMIRLSHLKGKFSAKWFDPRTGRETGLGSLNGQTDHRIIPPSQDDWILVLSAE